MKKPGILRVSDRQVYELRVSSTLLRKREQIYLTSSDYGVASRRRNVPTRRFTFVTRAKFQLPGRCRAPRATIAANALYKRTPRVVPKMRPARYLRFIIDAREFYRSRKSARCRRTCIYRPTEAASTLIPPPRPRGSARTRMRRGNDECNVRTVVERAT